MKNTFCLKTLQLFLNEKSTGNLYAGISVRYNRINFIEIRRLKQNDFKRNGNSQKYIMKREVYCRCQSNRRSCQSIFKFRKKNIEVWSLNYRSMTYNF